jgi:ribitol 2-dehydrogenase
MSALAGRIAVVTGASSGIGAALTARLVAEGATVCGIARGRAALSDVAARHGASFVPIVADLSERDERARAVREISAHFDRVHVLVHDAALCLYETPLGLAPEDWARLFETNVLAAIDLARAFVPRMERGDRIVQISSVTARHLPAARFGPYATTKAALEHATEAMRLELAARGIGVSVVAPGLVDTPLYGKVPGFAPAREKLREAVPRWLSPDEVADAVMYVLTRSADVVVTDLVVLPAEQAR